MDTPAFESILRRINDLYENSAMTAAEVINKNRTVVTRPEKLNLPLTYKLGISPRYQLRMVRNGNKQYGFYYERKGDKDPSLKNVLWLDWDGKTFSWWAIDHNLEQNLRRKALGERATMQLKDIFGVIRSTGVSPQIPSNEAKRMWERIGATLQPIGEGASAYIIRSTKKTGNRLSESGNRTGKINKDRAQIDEQGDTGGIDLTTDRALTVKNNGQDIKFHLDQAQLTALQNAPGFGVKVLYIRPMLDLKHFLTTP